MALHDYTLTLLERQGSLLGAAAAQDQHVSMLQLQAEVEQGEGEPEDEDFHPVALSPTDALLTSLLEVVVTGLSGEAWEAPRPLPPLILALREEFQQRLGLAQAAAVAGEAGLDPQDT